jgi:hypothetical protein
VLVLPQLVMALTAGQGPPPQFQVHSVDSQVRAGVVEKLADDGSLTFRGAPAIEGSKVICLRRANAPLPPWPREPHLLFANGDRLAGTIVDCDDSALRFQPAFTGNAADVVLRVPLSRIAVVWLTSMPRDLSDNDPRHSVMNAPRRRDVLLLRNGDTVPGSLLGIDARAAQTRWKGDREATIDNAAIAAVAFNSALARSGLPKGVHARLTLTDGSRLTCIRVSGDADSIRCQTDFKASFTVPWQQIAALDIVNGPAVALSDLKPKRYQYTPSLQEDFALMIDRNLTGGQLSLRTRDGVSHFDKGLALHARCEVVYALDAKYQQFDALIGLDPELGSRGDAEVRIFLDGKEPPPEQVQRLTPQTESWPARVDVKGVKELTIQINCAGGGHVHDAVNLGDARLILAK